MGCGRKEGFYFSSSVLSEIFVRSRHYFSKVFMSVFIIGNVLPSS